MTAPRNDHGLYEVTIAVKFVVDPAMVGQGLSYEDLLVEIQSGLNTMSEVIDRAEVRR
jgi:hypothetical protein